LLNRDGWLGAFNGLGSLPLALHHTFLYQGQQYVVLLT
jgi:hypothetical protein